MTGLGGVKRRASKKTLARTKSRTGWVRLFLLCMAQKTMIQGWQSARRNTQLFGGVTTGAGPGSRWAAAARIDPGGTLWLFGG
jgi:hypothetical protein